MEATEMFLIRHLRLHAQVERLTEELDEKDIREPLYPGANPLAWLLWHMGRTEDSAVSLICEEPQVLDDGWQERLRVELRCAGTGMTIDEVIDLSRKVHLASLVDYWKAVGERTEKLVAPLRPSDLDQVLSQERINRFVEQAVEEGPTVARLQALMSGISLGSVLVWLPLTHNYEHVGQADFIRGLLGRPGRF